MKQSSSPMRHSLGAIVPREHFCAHGARKQSGNMALVETESRPMANVYTNVISGSPGSSPSFTRSASGAHTLAHCAGIRGWSCRGLLCHDAPGVARLGEKHLLGSDINC